MKHVSSIRLLVATWLGLLLLLAATTASSYVPLGVGNTIVNGGIAVIKMGLIAIAFMHLNRSDAAVRLAAGAALLFLFFLAFLSFGDMLTRR
jgi:caa(3)-type oxidase subunit IV